MLYFILLDHASSFSNLIYRSTFNICIITFHAHNGNDIFIPLDEHHELWYLVDRKVRNVLEIPPLVAMVFFRNLRTEPEGNKRFRFYCYFILSCAILITLGTIVEAFRFMDHRFIYVENIEIFIYILIATGVIDVLLLILTAINVLRISKTSSGFENSRFKDEKNR